MEEKRRTRIENGKVLLCFLIPALFCAWFRTAENYDDYWNLTFAKNVADCLLPYRDFNMLQTPLSCFLSGGILALFGKELIVLRLLGVVLFIGIMLVLPLCSIIVNSLGEGIKFYLQSISTEYVRSALLVTLLATVIAVAVNTFFGVAAAWLLTKFSFRGKQILATLIDIPFSISPVIVGLAFLMTFGRLGWTYPGIRAINQLLGTNIRITFALPGVVLATIFVTFPYVSREIIPILNAEGKDEAEKLYLRLLLVTDHICGMTDSHAKRLYQELNGII